MHYLYLKGVHCLTKFVDGEKHFNFETLEQKTPSGNG